jgi:hypothetical protein
VRHHFIALASSQWKILNTLSSIQPERQGTFIRRILQFPHPFRDLR